MKSRVLPALVALVVVSIIAGCSDAPTAQYDSSKAALAQARIAEAEAYAPTTFKEASDSINAAMAEIQKQEGRFSAFRDFERAESIIASAERLAAKAQSDAVAEKERVRLQDSVLVAEIEALINETRSTIASAPRGKGSRVDLKMMQEDLDAAETALAAETAELQSGNYLAAEERLTAIKAQVASVKSDIAAAVSALTKK